MNGYAGKILRVNLTKRSFSVIHTSDYEAWVGGHGMGSAIFYDIIVREKGIDLESIKDGFDERNIVTFMTSPLCGTLAPGAASRTEVQGIGVQQYPAWFTRSNFGGRFAAMLKSAGWDGIVIEGQADLPVFLDIRDDNVHIRRCDTTGMSLWGMNTWECQQQIWDYVNGGDPYGDWNDLKGNRKNQTTQRPAVVAIGQAGENLARMACMVHDAGNSSGQCGFGGVFGAKKLKAISVIGTGGVSIADPAALVEVRLWAQKNYSRPPYELIAPNMVAAFAYHGTDRFSSSLLPLLGNNRPAACVGCHYGCKERNDVKKAVEATCVASIIYLYASILFDGEPDAPHVAIDLANQYGINAYEIIHEIWYLWRLHTYWPNIFGPDKPIDHDLDFSDFGKKAFIEDLLKKIALRLGIGDALAEGLYRAVMRWEELPPEAVQSGALEYPYWGMPEHLYDPRAEVYWGYGSILGDRDINEHCFNWPFYQFKPVYRPHIGNIVNLIAAKLLPYRNGAPNPGMLDFNTPNIYSQNMADLVAWHRHYARFWKQSVLFCDHRYPDFINPNIPTNSGLTPEAEPRILNAVTGKQMTFVDGMEIGRRIWNLDQAIWTLQGRHRDDVKFADYIYEVPYGKGQGTFEAHSSSDYELPGRDESGDWAYVPVNNRYIDRTGFEQFKDLFYKLEGWDPASGYPTRRTLEGLNLGYVADDLETKGKLGN